MSDKTKTAFPCVVEGYGNPQYYTPGMTLREYAAIAAMQGLLSNSGGPIQANGCSGWGIVNCNSAEIASLACEVADALINELAKVPS